VAVCRRALGALCYQARRGETGTVEPKIIVTLPKPMPRYPLPPIQQNGLHSPL
jgi:hypothetical protein